MTSVAMMKGGRILARFAMPEEWREAFEKLMPAGETRCKNTFFKRGIDDTGEFRMWPAYIVKEPIPQDVLAQQGIVKVGEPYNPVEVHFNWAIDFGDDMDEFYWFMHEFVCSEGALLRTLKYSPHQLAEVSNGGKSIDGIGNIKRRIDARDKKWFDTERPAAVEQMRREKEERELIEKEKKERARLAKQRAEEKRAAEVAQWAGDW